MSSRPNTHRTRGPRTARELAAAGLVGGAILLPLVATTPAAAAINLCGHPTDSVPPQISSLTFSSLTASTRGGTTSVTLTADASDTATGGAGSGVKTLTADLFGPRTEVRVKLHLSSGTAGAGVWTGKAIFTKKSWPGTYKLNDVSIVDAANNYQDYSNYGATPSEPTAVSLQTGWDSQLTLTGPKPTKPKPPHRQPSGTLSAFTITPGSVDTTTSTKRVVITARFTGHQPVAVAVDLYGKPGKSASYFDREVKLRLAGREWRGRLTVPQWVGSVKPQVELGAQFARGFSPGWRSYDSAKLKSLGFSSTVAITSGIDTATPRLTGLTVTPDSVNTTTGPQTVTVTATATDVKSGVKGIAVSFSKFSNNIVFGAGSNPAGATSAAGYGGGPGYDGYDNQMGVRLTKSGGKWTGTVTFRRCVLSGKWRVDLLAYDNANNVLVDSSARLTRLGFPGTLQATAAPQYVYDPVVTSATAAGASHQITLDFNEGVKNLTAANLTAYAVSPASQRYLQALPITTIACSNGTIFLSCTSSAGLVTSAILTIPAVTGGANYEVWADLNATTSQVTDGGDLPVSWQYAIAQVKGD